MKILDSRAARILTVVLLLQGGAYYAVALRGESAPAMPPLASVPDTLKNWSLKAEYPLEPEVQQILRADDTLNRVYASSENGRAAGLFIAFFKTQRSGQAPHSPRNCLPGAGWEPVTEGTVTVNVPQRPDPITVNQYVVARGGAQTVVLYWYQSHNRVIASEYSAKLWLVLDSIHYRRSDTALVRITVPAPDGNTEAARATGISFLQSVYPDVAKWAAL